MSNLLITMRSLLLTLIVLLSASGAGHAQTVKDDAFARKLSGLLSADVPAVDMDHVPIGKAVFLDAREREEYDVSHIAGALPVGYKDFDMRSLQLVPKDTVIVVYCSVGYRSEKITEKLLEAGFTNVHNLYGGIFEWVNTGHPLVDSTGRTDKVHAYNRNWSQWVIRGEKIY